MADTAETARAPARTRAALVFASHTATLSLAAVLNALISWTAFVLITRAFGLEAAGVAGLAQALIVFAFYFTNLALRAEILRGQHPEAEYRALLALRIGASLLVLAPLGLLLAANGEAWPYLGAAALVFVVKFFEAVFDIRIGYLQRAGRHGRILAEAALRLVAIVAAMAGAAYTLGALGGTAAATALAFVALFAVVTSAAPPRPTRAPGAPAFAAVAGRVLRKGVVFGAAAAATAASAFAVRLVVEHQGGLGATGAVVACYQFVVLAGIVQAAMAQFVLQKAAPALAKGRRTGAWLAFALGAGLALGLGGGAFFHFAGAPILALVFGPDMVPHAGLLRDLFLAHALVFAMAMTASLVHAIGAKGALLAGGVGYTALAAAVCAAAYPTLGLDAVPVGYAAGAAGALGWYAWVVVRGRGAPSL